MAKPRIILADTDEGYLLALETRFVQEFFGEIHLEIITDHGYFVKLFSTPQQADIVVVSEDMFDESLLRHEIGNLFLLSEKYDSAFDDIPGVHPIFKYSSTNIVFTEITGRSGNVVASRNYVTKQTQIVSICSAVGGVGKTTLAMGMSAALANNYKKILYIGAQKLQTFQRLLNDPSPISGTDIYEKLSVAGDGIFRQIQHTIRKEQFAYLPPFKAPLMSLGLSFNIFNKIILAAKRTNEYDVIVVDISADMDLDLLKLLEQSDRVFVITDQSEASAYATDLWSESIHGIDSEKYEFICTKYKVDEPNAYLKSGRTAITEYIDYILMCDTLKTSQLSESSEIQKIAYLVL